jgi:hypothetical protein
MTTEVIYPDGSMSTFHEGGGATHEGMGITRLRLISARSALSIWLRQADEGKPAAERYQLTRNGHRLAVLNVIEPLSGKQFASATGRCTDKACRAALAECERMLASLEDSAVVFEVE